MQMCKPCTHIIIVQIVINNEKLHSIYKYEMDLKLYALTFKVKRCTTKAFLKMFLLIEIQFVYNF